MSKNKKKKNQTVTLNIHDAMDSRLKLRRGMVELHKAMQEEYSFQSKETLLQIIGEQEKRLKAVQETRHFYLDVESSLQENYYNQSIVKSVNCINNRRPFHPPAFCTMVSDLSEFFAQLKMIFQMEQETHFFDILQKVKLFMDRPRNILAHVYLDYQLFNDPSRYFGGETYLKLVTRILSENEFQVEPLMEQERVLDFMEKMALVAVEYLGKYMRNPYRQRRAFSKLYHDISLMIHMANQTQQQLELSSPALSQLAIEMGLKMMSDQLHMGYSQNLYSQVDFPFVLFYLEYIYGLMDNNQKNWLLYPKDFLKCL